MRPEVSAMREREVVTLDKQRNFSPRQKERLFERAKGCCELCGEKIKGQWIAGHIIAHSIGGRTILENGRVECPKCAIDTHADDTDTAARCKRRARYMREGKGRKGTGRKIRSNPKIQSPKFKKHPRYVRGVNGTRERT